MKTMTKKEFEAELEIERKSAVRVVAIGSIVLIVSLVAVLLLLANDEEPKKETKYVEPIMIA